MLKWQALTYLPICYLAVEINQLYAMGRMQWRGFARALELYPEVVSREEVDLIFDRVKRTRRLGGDKYMSALALAGIEDLGRLDVATQIGATQFVAAIMRLSLKAALVADLHILCFACWSRS